MLFGFSFLNHAQNEVPKNMPPVKILPKPGDAPKKIFELPYKTEYQVFDNYGNFITKGNAQFIDCSKYKKGSYFIRYNGKTERFEVK